MLGLEVFKVVGAELLLRSMSEVERCENEEED